MKTMKRIITILIMLLALPVGALAQPPADPGVLPSSPLWQLDLFFERLQVAIAANPEVKARIKLEHLAERSDELEAEIVAEHAAPAALAQARAEQDASEANAETEKISDVTKRHEVSALAAAATAKHIEVLRRVLAKVPEQAKDAIMRAIERSETKQKVAENTEARAVQEAAEAKVILEDVDAKARLAVAQRKYR